nr:MAG TPA: hypothetical protein [Caudoviricetes sp.]
MKKPTTLSGPFRVCLVLSLSTHPSNVRLSSLQTHRPDRQHWAD